MNTHEDSTRLLRAAHLIAARMAHAPAELARTVTAWMRYTTHIAASFYLTDAQHRRAAELAVAYGEAELAKRLCEIEAAS